MRKKRLLQFPSNAVRHFFEAEELIYLPQWATWHGLRDCIWAHEHIHIPGKMNLNPEHIEHTILRGYPWYPRPDIRRTSKRRVERTIFRPQPGTFHQHLTNDLRKKAHAICRYAVHYGSRRFRPSPDMLYQKLKNLRFFLCPLHPNGAAVKLSMTVDGQLVEVESDESYFDLIETESYFEIRLPFHSENREIRILRQLPIAFLKILGVPDPLSGVSLGSVLIASSLFRVNALLKQLRIIQVPDIPTITDDDLPRSLSTLNHLVQDLSIQPNQVPVPSVVVPTVTASSIPLVTSLDRPDLYRELLCTAVYFARNTDLPLHRAMITTTIPGIPFDAMTAVESTSNASPKFRYIGAAGELFAYEILASLQLPGFGLDTWQSTMRNHVRLHDQYANVPFSNAYEDGDILYADTSGLLTQKLITKGYLEGHRWVGRKPKYFFEVKTTVGPMDTPFYPSADQISIMERMALTNYANQNIYVIWRVFQLGKLGMGFTLYVDPYTLEKQGVLRFESVDGKWQVTPT
ncbi:hypothetical protein BT63DRAFT_454729 [Microthyrium microscopicum]|uniref:Uncharacterized protein n=1 Tax=Microthyrium microscopicum TaxID=703497 RepID=A0A6A6UFG8_9PEZI|nr:hypothetical protein BT63DRAFT_454729 [Microthyrium microscopicum]